MKKFLCVILSLVLCVSLCACSSNAKKISEEAIKEKFANREGTLDIQKSGDRATEFSYTHKGVNVSKLSDREFCEEALYLIVEKPGQSKYSHMQVCNAILATMSVVNLVEGSDDEVEKYIDVVFDIVCEGESWVKDGWTISATMNEASDSITIRATTK